MAQTVSTPAWSAIGALDLTQWATLLAVFLAVALALEGLSLLWHEQRSPAARRLRARLKAWVPEWEDRAGASGANPLAARLWSTDGRASGASWLHWRLAQAAWGWSAAPFMGLCVALGALAGLSVLLVAGEASLAGAALALMAAAVAGAAPLLLLEHRRHRRLRQMGRQLPDMLDLLARALRSGHALSAALQMASEEGPQPLSQALRAVHDQIAAGRDPDEAFEMLVRLVPLEDVRFFVVALRLQRQTGGALAEVLGNIAGLVRQRLQLQDKVRVLTAEARLSAWVLGAMPLVTAGVIHLIRADFIRVLWTDPAGLRVLQVATLLFAAGVVWLWRLTQLRV